MTKTIHCHDGRIWEDVDPVMTEIDAVHDRKNIVELIKADLLKNDIA